MVSEKHIISGPNFKSATFLQELDGTSLDRYLLDAIKRRTNQVYMIESITNEKLTVKEYFERSHNLAAQLQSLGCSKNAIIGIISENCLEYPIAILGTLLTGAALTCFNPAYIARELEHTVNISQPSIIFCSPQNYDKVILVKKATSCIKYVIIFDTGIENHSTSHTSLLYSTLIKPSFKKYQKVANEPGDLAAILYSSGTTGFPKGVMLTHKNMVYMTKLGKEEDLFELPGSIGLITLPMFHAFGFNINFISLVRDQTLVVMRKYEEERFLAMIEKYKIKYLFLVPTIMVFLLKDPVVNKYDISCVESVVCGAASIKNETEQAFTEKLKLKSLQQGYGMTECTLATTVKIKGSTKLGSCGPAVAGSRLKVVDLHSGNNVGFGETGEICIKGPHLMKGYYMNEKATRETIDKDGWLHSGDIGYYDEDGEFFIVDREKDLIKYKGFQVAPAELEALLLKHTSVYDAAVIGLPDEVAGEIPKAFVVKQSGCTVSEEELIQYIAGIVSPQKRIRGGVTFVSEIPKNPSGKILRRKLRDLLKIKLKSKY